MVKSRFTIAALFLATALSSTALARGGIVEIDMIAFRP